MSRAVVTWIWSAALVLGTATTASAQTTVNPDVSVIPRFRIDSNDGEKLRRG